MQADLRIVIVDDHEIFRIGLRQVIEKAPHLKVVAEAADYETALQCLQVTEADIAILDIVLQEPDRDGYAVARAIRERRLSTGVIMLTGSHQERYFLEAMRLGVKGYVLKERSYLEILEAIHAVAAGLPFISPTLSPLLLEHYERTATLRADHPALLTLTPTERLVLQRVGDNKTNKQIADELGIAVRTVENHRQHICDKLNLHGPHVLLPFARDHRTELE